MELNELFVKKQKKWINRYFGKHNFKGIISPFLKSRGKYLDFGCGFGNLLFLLAKENPSSDFYGVDSDKNKIKIGRENFNLKNISLKSSLQIPHSLDTVSMINVLHELEDPESILKKIFVKMNSGGHILIYDFRKVSRNEFRGWYDKKALIGEYCSDFEEEYLIHNKWCLKEFIKMMSFLGFEEVFHKKAGDYWFWYIGKKL